MDIKKYDVVKDSKYGYLRANPIPSEEEVNQYTYNINKASEEITKASENNQTKKEIDTLIDNYIKLIAKASLKDVNDIDEYKAFLKDIREKLTYFRKDLTPKQLAEAEKINDITKVKNLVNSLFILEPTVEKINEYLSNLNVDITKTNVEKLQ